MAWKPGGGALVFEVGYHPCKKKKHIIRVVFQDQAMYTRTSFRGAKLEKKGVFFCHIDKFSKDMTNKLRKTHAKCVFRLFSYLKNTCLRCVLAVLLRGWYPAWNTSAPPWKKNRSRPWLGSLELEKSLKWWVSRAKKKKKRPKKGVLRVAHPCKLVYYLPMWYNKLLMGPLLLKILCGPFQGKWNFLLISGKKSASLLDH